MSPPPSAAAPSTAPTGGGPRGPKSKAYSSTVAVQTNATKYRGKYKELKKRVCAIERENDKLHLKTLRIKRNIQRMRLERALLYESLDATLPAAVPHPPSARPEAEAEAEASPAASSVAAPPRASAVTGGSVRHSTPPGAGTARGSAAAGQWSSPAQEPLSGPTSPGDEDEVGSVAAHGNGAGASGGNGMKVTIRRSHGAPSAAAAADEEDEDDDDEW